MANGTLVNTLHVPAILYLAGSDTSAQTADFGSLSTQRFNKNHSLIKNFSSWKSWKSTNYPQKPRFLKSSNHPQEPRFLKKFIGQAYISFSIAIISSFKHLYNPHLAKMGLDSINWGRKFYCPTHECNPFYSHFVYLFNVVLEASQ